LREGRLLVYSVPGMAEEASSGAELRFWKPRDGANKCPIPSTD